MLTIKLFKKNILFHFLRSGSGNTYRNGTCFTSAECTEKGGSASGSCAGGYVFRHFIF